MNLPVAAILIIYWKDSRWEVLFPVVREVV